MKHLVRDVLSAMGAFNLGAALLRMPLWKLWLLMIIVSLGLTEITVSAMEMLLLGRITYDYLLTGLVAATLAASLVLGIVLFLISDIRRINSSLATSKTELRRSNADLQRFAEVTAHHLQEPARRLLIYADRLRTRLKGRIDDAEIQLSLDVIGQQARRQQNLLRDVERYLAASQPRGQVEKTAADPIVARVLERLSDRLLETGATVTLGHLPAAWIDAPRLTDLFEVALDNTLQHGVTQSPLRITIDGECQGSLVRYRISDNGPGIEAGYRERVFRVFERLSSSGAGTGIGLAIGRRIAESRGGRAWVEETPGGGCCVVFELSAEDSRLSNHLRLSDFIGAAV